MIKKIFLLSSSIVFIISGLAYAGQVNLQTYYPAPTAVYNKIYLTSQSSNICTGSNDGTLFMQQGSTSSGTTSSQSSLQVCNSVVSAQLPPAPQPFILQCYNLFCSYSGSSGCAGTVKCAPNYLPLYDHKPGSPGGGSKEIIDTFQIEGSNYISSVICCQVQ